MVTQIEIFSLTCMFLLNLGYGLPEIFGFHPDLWIHDPM